MKRWLAGLFVAGLFAGPAVAQDWQGQLDGLDGVTIACSNANREAYAATICDRMMERASAVFDAAGIPVAVIGSYFSHDEERPERPEAMKRPLDVTIFVRGTNSGNIFAINLRSTVSVAYEAAVERGETAFGRKGDLVMWEGVTTGAGPRRGLSDAITKAGFEKLSKELGGIVAAWPPSR